MDKHSRKNTLFLSLFSANTVTIASSHICLQLRTFCFPIKTFQNSIFVILKHLENQKFYIQTYPILQKTQYTKVWAVFWNKSFEYTGDLRSTHLCITVQHRDLRPTDDRTCRLPFSSLGSPIISDAIVHSSISCWSGFFTSRNKPWFNLTWVHFCISYWPYEA